MKTYRVKSARHARALGLKVGATYEADMHPDHERALIAGGHVSVMHKPAKRAEGD